MLVAPWQRTHIPTSLRQLCNCRTPCNCRACAALPAAHARHATCVDSAEWRRVLQPLQWKTGRGLQAAVARPGNTAAVIQPHLLYIVTLAESYWQNLILDVEFRNICKASNVFYLINETELRPALKLCCC